MATWEERQRKQLEALLTRQGPVRTPNPVDRMLNKTNEGHEAWKADRAERVKKSDTDRALGIPSRDRMTPSYGKEYKEPKKTTAWQSAHLKDLPIKKYGRSYAEKFTNWANEQGIPENRHNEFKTWLNANEQGLKSDAWNATEGQKERNVARTTARNEADKLQAQKKIEQQTSVSPERQEKEKKNGPFDWLSNIDKKFNEKAKGSAMERAVNRSFNTMSGSSNREIMAQLLREGPKAGKEKQYEDLARQYESNFGGDLSALDVVSDLSGYLVPGAMAYKGARAIGLGAKGLTSGPSMRNVGQFAKEGAVAGGLLGGAEVALREDISPDTYSAKDNLAHLGINVAAGAALDPLIGMAGPLAKAISGKSAEKALNSASKAQIEQALRSGDYTPLEPLRAPDGGTSYKSSNPIEDILSGRRNAPDTSPNILNNQFKSVDDVSPTIQDVLTAGPKAPERAVMPNRSAASDVSIASDAPLGERIKHWTNPDAKITPADRDGIVSTIDEANARVDDFINKNYDQLKDAELRKDEKVFSKYNNAKMHMRHASGFDEQWRLIKEVQDQFAKPEKRPQWAKFSLPKGYSKMDEFKGLPRMFIDQKSSVGYDNALEMAGFDNWEAFKDHLENIYGTLKTKKQDVMNTARFTPEAEKAAMKIIEDTDATIEQRLMESTGIGKAREQVSKLEEVLKRTEAESSSFENARTIPTERGVIDRLLGRNMEEPVPQDPYDGVFSDEDIDAMIMKQQNQVASGTEAVERIKKVPNSNPTGIVAGRVDDYALSPIANPDISPVGKGPKKGFRESFDSRLQPAKKLEKDLSKNHRDALEDAGVKILRPQTEKSAAKGKVASPAKGNAIAFEDSPAKLIQALSRSGAKATRSYQADMAPIKALQKKHNIRDVDAEEYIIAKHAEDIFKNEASKLERISELRAEQELLEANRITNEDAGMRKAIDKREQEVLKELETLKPYEIHEKVTPEWVEHKLSTFGKYEGFDEIQKIYVQNQRKNLEILKESGHITDETMESLIKKYPNYVSFSRDIPQKKGQKPVKSSVNGRNPLATRKHGSKDLEIQMPFVSALQNRNVAITAADRNKAIHAVHKMTKVKGLDEVFREVNPNVPGFKVRSGENIIEGSINGKKVYYDVPAVLKNAYDNIGSADHDFWGNKMLSGLADVFRKTTTNWNVGFHLWAGGRDSLNALANSRTGATVIDTTHGFLDSFMGPTLEKISGGRFKSLREMYLDQGADMGGFISQDVNSPTSAVKRVRKGSENPLKKALKSPVKAVEKFGMKMEHGPRLGEVRSAKRKGYSDEDAVFEAIDLIDYSDQGAVTRHLNKYDPYLSATIRGNMRTLQAAKNNPKQFMTVGMLNVAVPTVGIWMLQQSDLTNDVQRDKINNMQEYQKNTTWAIPVPNSDEVKFMPKGFILGQLFANPIERTLSKLVTDKSKGLDEIGRDTAKDFIQALVPPTSVIGYETIMELIANKDFFTGIPIEDEWDQKADKPKSERYSAYNSEVSKAIAGNPLGDLLGVSPAQVDHVLKSQTGTLGKQALNSIDNALSKGGKSPAKTQTTGEIVNPLSRFDYKETASSGLYDRIVKAGERDAKEKKAEAGGRRPKGFEKTGDEKIAADFKEIQDEINGIRDSTTLTAKEKSERIGKLRREQRALGTKFISE